MDSRSRGSASGQSLVLVVIAMAALLAMTALVVDGGNAYAQQRATQNGSDAAAEAGAVVLMQKLVGVSPSPSGADVSNAVQGSAASNSIVIAQIPDGIGGQRPLACYTDLNGTVLDASGNAVSSCSDATAAYVSPATAIPPCAACPGKFAAGVQVSASRSFRTYFGGVVGMDNFTASAGATAISGYMTAYGGPVIPVTFPLLATGCDTNGDAVPGTFPWPVGQVISVDLCKGGPGNVGWIDWTPTAGGASELANAILTPNNPAIVTPGWYYVTQTGSVSSSQVQSAMDTWNGHDILLPIFNATCDAPNGVLLPAPGQITDCAGNGGTLGGNGTQQWYFLVGFAQFHLQESFLNGSDGGLCAAYAYSTLSTGNVSSCLIGSFVGPDEAVSQGAGVGAGGGANGQYSPPGVQLIH